MPRISYSSIFNFYFKLFKTDKLVYIQFYTHVFVAHFNHKKSALLSLRIEETLNSDSPQSSCDVIREEFRGERWRSDSQPITTPGRNWSFYPLLSIASRRGLRGFPSRFRRLHQPTNRHTTYIYVAMKWTRHLYISKVTITNYGTFI